MQTLEDAQQILKILEAHHFEAYLVGGCVRDMLLAKKPLDYDITTNATPEDIERIFEKTIPTGKAYGTITVIINHVGYETTTYRQETEYTDGRRPKAIHYSKHLTEDLSRRDFTINALAMNFEGKIQDYFNGRHDLEKCIIRTIGNPQDRFSEDYLRMLRAIRLSCSLNFDIESSSLKAIQENSAKIKFISSERVRDELTKILMTSRPSIGFRLLHKSHLLTHILPELEVCYGFQTNSKDHHQDVFNHTMEVLDNTKPSLELRLAALLHDISKPQLANNPKNSTNNFHGHHLASAEMCKHILFQLKYSKKTIYDVVKLVEYHNRRALDLSPMSIKILIRALDSLHFPNLIELMEADIKASSPPYDFSTTNELWRIYNQVLEHSHPVSIKDLAINGYDIMNLGYRQREIKEQLEKSLTHVLYHPEDNNKTKLLSLLTIK